MISASWILVNRAGLEICVKEMAKGAFLGWFEGGGSILEVKLQITKYCIEKNISIKSELENLSVKWEIDDQQDFLYKRI